MNLQSLVPPLELCKLIPKGEFEDSCYVRGFMVISLHGYGVDFLVTREELEELKKDNTIDEYYPAPTLQEILAELKGFEMIGNTCYSIMKGHVIANGRNVVECALRLWLENKGIINANE